jgi:MFS family permease
MIVFGFSGVIMITEADSSGWNVLLGRVAAGIGAAGALASISLHLSTSIPTKRQHLDIAFLTAYSLARFLGPL